MAPKLCSPLGNQDIDLASRRFEYLKGIELTDSNHRECDLEIDLLFGCDFLWKFFTGITRRGDDNYGPVASETTLGWVLSGPLPTDQKPTLSSVNFIATHALRVAAEVPNEITRDRVERDRVVEPRVITGEDQSYAKMTVGDIQEIQSQEEHKVLGRVTTASLHGFGDGCDKLYSVQEPSSTTCTDDHSQTRADCSSNPSTPDHRREGGPGICHRD